MIDKSQEIKKNAYKNTNITSINISDKILIIRRGAFENCKYLKKVIFGINSKIEVIEPGAFRGCSKLKVIIFPNKTIRIYDVNVDISTLNEGKIRELIWLVTRPIQKQKNVAKTKKRIRIKQPTATSRNDAKGRHYSWYRPK